MNTINQSIAAVIFSVEVLLSPLARVTKLSVAGLLGADCLVLTAEMEIFAHAFKDDS